jgi:hypothetical protein
MARLAGHLGVTARRAQCLDLTVTVDAGSLAGKSWRLLCGLRDRAGTEMAIHAEVARHHPPAPSQECEQGDCEHSGHSQNVLDIPDANANVRMASRLCDGPDRDRGLIVGPNPADVERRVDRHTVAERHVHCACRQFQHGARRDEDFREPFSPAFEDLNDCAFCREPAIIAFVRHACEQRKACAASAGFVPAGKRGGTSARWRFSANRLAEIR